MPYDRGDPQLDELLRLVDEQLRLSRRIVRLLVGRDASQNEVLRAQSMFDQLDAALTEARHMLSPTGRHALHRADEPEAE